MTQGWTIIETDLDENDITALIRALKKAACLTNILYLLHRLSVLVV